MERSGQMTTLAHPGPLTREEGPDPNDLQGKRAELENELAQMDSQLKGWYAQVEVAHQTRSKRGASVSRRYQHQLKRLRWIKWGMLVAAWRKLRADYRLHRSNLEIRRNEALQWVDTQFDASTKVPSEKITELHRQSDEIVAALADLDRRQAVAMRQQVSRFSAPAVRDFDPETTMVDEIDTVPATGPIAREPHLPITQPHKTHTLGWVAVTLVLVMVLGTLAVVVRSHLKSPSAAPLSHKVATGVVSVVVDPTQPLTAIAPTTVAQDVAASPAVQSAAVASGGAVQTAAPQAAVPTQAPSAIAATGSLTPAQIIAEHNSSDNQMEPWVPATVQYWAADVQKVGADPRVIATVDGHQVNIVQGTLRGNVWYYGRENLLYVMMLLDGGNSANGPISLDGITSQQMAIATKINPLVVSDPHQQSYDDLLFAARHLNEVAAQILTNTCLAKANPSSSDPSTFDRFVLSAWYGQPVGPASCKFPTSTSGQIPAASFQGLMNLFNDWHQSTSAQWQEMTTQPPDATSMKILLQQAQAAETAFLPLPSTS
jgi:hypothetical protein